MLVIFKNYLYLNELQGIFVESNKHEYIIAVNT